MKKKNVLIILPSFVTGGAEKVILSYYNNFKSSNISLKLLLINSKIFPKTKRDKDLLIFNYSRFIYSLPKTLKIIKEFKFDIIISTFPNISAILLLLKYLKIINSKIIIRQPNIIKKSLEGNFKLFILKIFYKYLIKFANAVVVTSIYMKQEALKNKVNSDKLFLLRNPINVEETRKNTKPIKMKKNKINLIFVGRLVYQKGIDRILHLFNDHNKIELTIIGEGNLKKKLIQKAKNLGVSDKIKFLGKKKNPFGYIAGADYFILPSRWEGLPNCVLESLALGTPVIATKDVYCLFDFKENLANKSILIYENILDFSKQIGSLKKRKDYKSPKLRKSLLTNFISPYSYVKELNNIILNVK